MKILRLLRAIAKYCTDSEYRFLNDANRGRYNNLGDEEFLRRKFRAELGYELDLKNPKTFNEKLQWLKLYDRNPIYTTMVDKCAVKKYVADLIGEEYIIPTLGEWDNPDEIDFELLPSKFVLKCNHNSGQGMCICRDKTKIDIEEVRSNLKKGLKQNYYLQSREWPYKNVKPKIIAEKYMEDYNSQDLRDYKLMCFNGEVKCSFVCSNRFSDKGLHVTFFDEKWNPMPFERSYPSDPYNIPKPVNYDKMVELAEKLSEGIGFVRVDFYEVNGKIYFGELTFFPGSGMEAFQPEDWDYRLGEWIDLSGISNK